MKEKSELPPDRRLHAYVRVSTGHQAENGVSLEDQERRLRAWARDHGITRVTMYRDAGKSGSTLAGRPGLAAARAAAQRGDVLAALSLSRFGRSVRDVLDLASELQSRGVDLVSLKEDLNTTTAAGRMVFSMLAVLSQFESEQIGERTKSALEHVRRQGRKTGGAVPFGYSVAAGGRLVQVAREQRAIAFAVTRRRKGESLGEIAAALEARGVRRKSGRRNWSRIAVARVIARAARAAKERSG